jgi:Bacterial Ig-like domain (group 3)
MGGQQPAFLADETDGTWGKAVTVPGLPAGSAASAEVNSVSCASPGNCSAAGTYHNADGQQAFVVDEAGGTWETAQQVPGIAALNSGRAASVTSVSCGAPATCTAGGYYTDSHGIQQAFVVGETPDSATHIALTRTASTVTYGHEQAERFGYKVTSLATVTSGTVTVTSGGRTVCVSHVGANGSGTCSPGATRFPAGTVSAVAAYGGAPGLAPSSLGTIKLTVAKATSRTTLALSAARISYGHEQAERLTVTVSPRYAGTPAGSVTLKAGRTVVCVVKLASGKGSCRLTARELEAASYHLVADYGGSADFGSSVSAAKTLTVLK